MLNLIYNVDSALNVSIANNQIEYAFITLIPNVEFQNNIY